MFYLQYHGCYGTCSAQLKCSIRLDLKDCEILSISTTKYGTRQAIIKLSREKIGQLKKIETAMTQSLKSYVPNITPITLVYGNKIYAKIRNSRATAVVIKGVFIDIYKKTSAQVFTY